MLEEARDAQESGKQTIRHASRPQRKRFVMVQIIWSSADRLQGLRTRKPQRVPYWMKLVPRSLDLEIES
jgi:hypothetical protein